MKRVLTFCLMALILLQLPGCARADEVGRAWREAALHVPGSAMPDKLADQGDTLLFTFIDEIKKQRYEVLIRRDSAQFLQRTMVSFGGQETNERVLAEADIMRLVKDQYPDADIMGVFPRQEGDLRSFQAVFTRDRQRRLHRSLFHAQSGSLLMEEIWPADPTEGYFPLREALEGVLHQADNGEMTDVSIKRAGASNIYQVNVVIGGKERKLTINAKSGQIMNGGNLVDTREKGPESPGKDPKTTPVTPGKPDHAASPRDELPGLNNGGSQDDDQGQVDDDQGD